MANPTVRIDPATLRRPVDGDDAIGILTDAYECALVEDARSIVKADDDTAATCEHLRVLLGWLDGRSPRAWPRPPQPIDEESPF